MSVCDVCRGECDRPGQPLAGNLAGHTAWICTACREESKGRGQPRDTSPDHTRLADGCFRAMQDALKGAPGVTVERISDGFRLTVDPQSVRGPATNGWRLV